MYPGGGLFTGNLIDVCGPFFMYRYCHLILIIDAVCVLLDFTPKKWYIGVLLVCYKRTWFLVFNARCTPPLSWELDLSTNLKLTPHFCSKNKIGSKAC